MEPLKPLGSPKATHTTPSTMPVLSPLAAFAKQQRDHTEGSQSNDGGKVSVLASFAKSHHQQQSTVPYDDLLSPSSAATSASRPTLKRLDSTDKAAGSLAPLSLPSLPVSKKPDKQNAEHVLATEKADAKQDAAHENEKPQDKDTEEKAESRLPDEAKDTEVSGTVKGHAAEENASSTSEDFQVMDSDDESESNGRGDNESEDAKATFDVSTAEADLYASVSEEQGTIHLTRPALAKIFVPKASEIPLFQAILAHDEHFLKELLEQMVPEEILSVRDVEQRSLYHYAALCRSKRIKALAFSHVNHYYDRELDRQIQPLLEKSHQVHAWMEDGQHRSTDGWIPPRVKELQRQTTRDRRANLLRICECYDRSDRSIFHYAAVSPSDLTIEQEPHLLSVLQRHLSILSRKDACGKTPLHYAIESTNLRHMQWLFQAGAFIALKAKDVQELAHLTMSDAVRIQFLQNVQALDAINFKLRFEKGNYNQNQVEEGGNGGGNDTEEHGISIHLSATLERDTKTQSGPLLQSPLLKAAMFGNLEAVKLLLTKGADPMARDANGWTALHYCADGGSAVHLIMARVLLSTRSHVNVNARSTKGRTALHVAAAKKPANVANIDANAYQARFAASLLDHKADVNIQDSQGATALHLASRNSNIAVLKLLLSKECDPTIVDNTGACPLHGAASTGHVEMVRFLARWDAECRLWCDAVDHQGHKPIDVAINDATRRAMTVELVKQLLHCRARDDQRRGNATKRGQYEEYLSVHDKTWVTQRSSLHLAGMHTYESRRSDMLTGAGWTVLVQLQGYYDAVNPHTSSFSPSPAKAKHNKKELLAKNASNRFYQIVLALLKAKADRSISFFMRLSLFQITRYLSLMLMRTAFFLNAVCSYAGDKWGLTPLILAATIKDEVLMELMLGDGDDEDNDDEWLTKGDCNGNTALHYAYAFGHAQISNMLEAKVEDYSDIQNDAQQLPLDVTGVRGKLFPNGYREIQQRIIAWRQRS